MYTHINRDDRSIISDGLRRGESYAEIARRIGKDATAIGREVRRNRDPESVYDARYAHRNTRQRRAMSKIRSRKIENDPVLAYCIEGMLHPLRSPEVVAHEVGTVHETIYAWIARSRPDLTCRLPRRGKKRRRYGSKRQEKQGWTRHVRNIRERPQEAEERTMTKHFEGDTLRGKTKPALLTHTDRKSLFEVVHKVPNEGCDAAHAAITHDPRLKKARSFTYDRGSSFALWRMIERDTDATVYFADPRAPWQRARNENNNERLRRIYPKGFDFATVDQQDINATVWFMNHTKRKSLAWRTPCEMYGECCTSVEN